MHNYIILPSLSTLEAPTPYPIYEKQNNYFAYFFFFFWSLSGLSGTLFKLVLCLFFLTYSHCFFEPFLYFAYFLASLMPLVFTFTLEIQSVFQIPKILIFLKKDALVRSLFNTNLNFILYLLVINTRINLKAEILVLWTSAPLSGQHPTSPRTAPSPLPTRCCPKKSSDDLTGHYAPTSNTGPP